MTVLAPDAAVEREARFRAFVAEHREQAVSTAWRMLGGDRATAEDVAQDAFVRAYRALDSFRDDARLSTWFYRILVRTVQNRRRWFAIRRRWQGLFTDEAATEDPHATMMRRDVGLQRRIGEALDSLSAGQREVFVLVYLEGFTLTEAAEVLGKAPGTLKSHLHRALKSMRAQLADLRLGEADDPEGGA